jgi:hypothetical protein
MSTISSGTTLTTALVQTGDTTGDLVIKTDNGNTTAVTFNTAGAIGVGASPSYGSVGQYLQSAGNAAAATWATVVSSQWVTSGANISYTTGNVGIGTATANIYSTGNVTNALGVQASGTNQNGLIAVAATGTGYGGVEFGNATIRRSGIYALDGSALTFYTNSTNSGTGLTECIRITSSGNVGIGTASPINNGGYGGLTLNGTSGSLFSLMTNGTETGRIASLSDETSVQCKASTGYITFVQGVSGGTERMRIDSSGNLLVGTTSTLGSTANASLQISGGGGGPYVITCRNRDTSGGANQIEFQDGSGDVCGAINSNATTNTTAYATSSDYRLKENIAPMIGALDTVAQLKPVTWKWKHAPDVQGQGFIAHELQEVVPDCVTGEKDATKLVDIKDEEGNVISQEEVPVYQGIDTSFLVATLTAAIQEQQAIITELKTRIEVLENLA